MEKKQILVSFKNVSKKFRYWSERPTSLKSFLVDCMKGKMKFGKFIEFSVLDDISFEVQEGDFFGIMGRNGAGKSTMLKMLCGIYKPESGSIYVEKKIAPLIELGAGFNGELSGYENIFLNASILGFSRSETHANLQNIIDFSELGDMIYMPVKNYSSGMLVRLAFSIVAHVNAPILLVDEILAVGDVAFQEKCLKKIDEIHKEGRTLIFITHSMELVERVCNKCIVIDNKKKVFEGDPKSAAEVYLKAVYQPSPFLPAQTTP